MRRDEAHLEASDLRESGAIEQEVALLLKRTAKMAFKHGFLAGFAVGTIAATAACLWALLA